VGVQLTALMRDELVVAPGAVGRNPVTVERGPSKKAVSTRANPSRERRHCIALAMHWLTHSSISIFCRYHVAIGEKPMRELTYRCTGKENINL